MSIKNRLLLIIGVLIFAFPLPFLGLAQDSKKIKEAQEGIKILVLDGRGECNFCDFISDFANEGYKIFAPACNAPEGFKITELSYSFISQFDILMLRSAKVGEKEWNEEVKKYVEEGGKLVVLSDTENFYSSDNPTNHLASMWGVQFSGDYEGRAEVIEHPITKDVKQVSWCVESKSPGIDLCFDGIPSTHPEEAIILAKYGNQSALILIKDKLGEVIFGPNNGIMDNERLLLNIFSYFGAKKKEIGKKVKKEIFVFLDKNLNGEYDEGEEGIDGVRVALKYVNDEKSLIETTTYNGRAIIEIEESSLPREGEIELIIDFGKNFWSTANFLVAKAESITSLNVFPNYNLYQRILYPSPKDLFRTSENFKIPLETFDEKEILDYSLKRDAFSFPNWEDSSSKGYCCGITITNDLLFEKFYVSPKDLYYLTKSDIIQTKIPSGYQNPPEEVPPIEIPSKNQKGEKRKIELNERLEDVIRRHQLVTCPIRSLEKVLPAKLAALIGGEKKIKEINRKNIEILEKEIKEGRPIAVYLLNLQPNGINHAVLGVGFINVDEYFIGLVYENSFPYLKPLNLAQVSFVINKEGALVSKDEETSGYELIVVDSLQDLKDPEIEETTIKALNNVEKEIVEKILKKNLTLTIVSGDFSIEDKKCYNLIPGGGNLAFCLIEPKEKIKLNIKNALMISAVPTSNLTFNITSKNLREGKFFIERGGRLERIEYFYLKWGLVAFLSILPIIGILWFLVKNLFKKSKG